MAEGRIGDEGQRVNFTLNWCTNTLLPCSMDGYQNVTPWIWSVVRFDTSGGKGVPDHQIFPTYYVYENGKLVSAFAQSDLATFTKLDGSSQISAKSIQ
jgi:hypothetical protein